MNKPILIMAGNIKQAEQFAVEKGLQRKDWRYVIAIESILGMRDCSLVKVGSWYENDYNFLRIEDYCKTHNIKIY